MKRAAFIFYTFVLVAATLLTQQSDFPKLTGPYLGQKPPGMVPEIFAPGIVSTDKNEHSQAIFSNDGNDLFWSYYDQGKHIIMHMQRVGGHWIGPKKFLQRDLKDGNPFFSADGSKLIFQSDRRDKREDGSLNLDFWYVEKMTDGWSAAKIFDFPPNSEKWQLYGCQVLSGNFYFTSKRDEKSAEFQLYISRFNGERWQQAEPMPEIFNSSPVNWTPFVSPDESYIVFSSDRRGKGVGYNACDLYISYKNSDDEWTIPVHMGDAINTDNIERFPWVSPDGKCLFFVRGFGDVYWVSAKIIEELRPKEKK